METHDRDRETRMTRLHQHHRSEEIYHITDGKVRSCLDEDW